MSALALLRRDRTLPPVAELALATLVLAIVGAIWIASHIPGRAPLGVAIGFVAAAAAVLAANVVVLSRVRGFAWRTFFTVARWALLAYVVIAGMIEYAFVYDHTPTGQLVVMTLVLAVFAVNVPLILGFAVARHQPPDDR